MKKVFLAIVVTVFCAGAFAQKVEKITLSREGNFEMMAFLLDENVTVNMSNDGAISAFGVEIYSDRIPNFSRLDKFPGRTEYYSANDNEAFSGKVKYIGKTLITYYASFDNESLRGKVKSIGSTNFEYYSLSENETVRGKIKQAGSVQFGWYTTYDNEAMKGKLKSVGSTTLNYYASFDDKAFKGKIKSIGNATFTYYSSLEKAEYRGSLKSGTQMQTINGVKYYVKF